MNDAPISLIPIQRQPEEFILFGQTPAEKAFNERREELNVITPCEGMAARHFDADEDLNSDLLREGAKIAAKRVLPGVVACRSCPLLPECYAMGVEGIVGRDGVFGGEYFNVIAASKRPTKKQEGVRRHLREMLRQEGNEYDLGSRGPQARR